MNQDNNNNINIQDNNGEVYNQMLNTSNIGIDSQPIINNPQISKEPQNSQNNNKRTLIFTIIGIGIILIIVICLFVINKQKTGSPNDQQVEEKSVKEKDIEEKDIPETVQKQSAKYESKYVSKSALNQIILSSDFYNKKFIADVTKIFDIIDGRILDVKMNDDGIIFFLTPSNMYGIQYLWQEAKILNIDVKDNTKIELVTDDFIVLSNNHSKYTIYSNKMSSNNKDCDSIEISLDDDEYLIGNADSLYYDYIHVIKNVSREGILTKDYTTINYYSDDSYYGYEKELTHKFDKDLTGEIKDYIVGSRKTSPNGVILLDNNDLYYVIGKIGAWNTDGVYEVKYGPINNINKVWNTYYISKFFASKNNDSRHIYKYEFFEDIDTGVITLKEMQIELPSDVSLQNIEEIINTYNYSLKLFDGTVYDLGNEITKNEALTTLYKTGNVVAYFNSDGLDNIVMDDGNIYTITNDYLIKYYNLK